MKEARIVTLVEQMMFVSRAHDRVMGSTFSRFTAVFGTCDGYPSKWTHRFSSPEFAWSLPLTSKIAEGHYYCVLLITSTTKTTTTTTTTATTAATTMFSCKLN